MAVSDFLADRTKLIDSSGIRKVFDFASKLENPINLSIGQPDFDVPEEVKKEAISWIEKGFNRYTVTQGIPELRQKVAEHIKKTRGVEYDPETEVFITSGVSGGLLLSLMVLMNAGDEVIVPDPYFVMYKHLTTLLGGVPVFLDTYPDFMIYPDKLKKLITPRTKLMFINSPSNPTGVVLDEDVLREVGKVASDNGIFVISDEIYETFVYDDDFVSIAPFVDKSRLILLGGFSKNVAMTGWRVGWAAGPKEVISEMVKIQQYTFVCAPSFAQKAALKAFDLDYSEIRNKYRKKRDIIFSILSEEFRLVKPRGAFYAFPEVRKVRASEFVEAVIKNGVLIIPGSVFSEKDTHFRLSFAAPDDILEMGCRKIVEIHREL